MAAAEATLDSEDRIKDMITCSLCLEEFKDPRLLKCYHTFCRDCIRQLEGRVSHTITCPLCRHVTELSKAGVEDLPNNFYVTILKQSEVEGTPHCEVCSESVHASKRCTDCEQYLCEGCFKTHQNIKTTKSHRVLIIGADDEQRKVTQVLYCPKHKTEELKFYCNQCKLSICRDCKLTAHEGHTSEDLKDIAERTYKSVDVSTEALKFDVAYLTEKTTTLSDLKNTLQREAGDVDTKIRYKAKAMHEAIDKASNLLRQELASQTENEIKKIEKEKDRIRITSDSMKGLFRHMQNVLQFGTAADAMLTQKFLREVSENDIFEEEDQNIDVPIPAFSSNGVFSVNSCDVGRLKWIDRIRTPKFKVLTSLVRKFCVSSSLNTLVGSMHRPAQRQECMWVCLHGQSKPSWWRNLLLFTDEGACPTSRLVPHLHDFFETEDVFMVLSRHDSILYTLRPEKEPQSDSESAESRSDVKGTHNNILCHTFTSTPLSVSQDVEHNVIVLQYNKEIVTLSQKDFSVIRTLKPPYFVSPCKLECGTDGVIAVADPGAEAVFILNRDGSLHIRVKSPKKIPLSRPFYPRDICFSETAQFYVADYQNHCVVMFSKDYSDSTLVLWGRHVHNPTAIAFDRKGNLWAAHSGDQISVYGIKLM